MDDSKRCPFCGDTMWYDFRTKKPYHCSKCQESFECLEKYNLLIHPKILDIAYNCPESSVLSNLFPNSFEMYEGNRIIRYASMEAFLRTLVIKEDSYLVDRVSILSGFDAWRVRSVLPDWREKQELYFGSIPFPRQSEQYDKMITRAYDILFYSNALFRIALEKYKDRILVHTIGNNNPTETLLTAQTYEEQLRRLQGLL